MTVDTFLRVLAANPAAPIHLMPPDGGFVPPHFHVTEAGRVHKDFIDYGGTARSATACVLQVWVADDADHRLVSGKLARIVRLAGPLLGSADLPVEVEYGAEVMSQYPAAAVESTPGGLLLHFGSKPTACLAAEQNGVRPARAPVVA